MTELDKNELNEVTLPNSELKQKIFNLMDCAIRDGRGVLTVRQVRREVGGNQTAVTSLVREWRNLHPAMATKANEPGYSQEQIDKIIKDSWTTHFALVQSMAQARIEEMTAALEEREREARELDDMAYDTAKRAEEMMATAEKKLQEAEAIKNAANEKLEKMRVETESLLKEKEEEIKELHLKVMSAQEAVQKAIENTKSTELVQVKEQENAQLRRRIEDMNKMMSDLIEKIGPNDVKHN